MAVSKNETIFISSKWVGCHGIRLVMDSSQGDRLENENRHVSQVDSAKVSGEVICNYPIF